ncbi:MAG: hypothetical protein IJH12_10705 [Clostridia bacterium]|nr:hypothetical protein [Clostridia bacterium]
MLSTEASKTTTERSTTTTIVTTSRTTEKTTTTSTETTTTQMATTTTMITTETTTTEPITEVELVDAAEYICFVNPTEAYVQENYPNDMYSYEMDDVVETIEEMYTEAEEYVWNGKVLTKSSGIVPAGETPSGYKETYYNMNMMGCLDLIGYSCDGYAVRDDGVKTYDGYVMVASPDLYAYPKGSYVPTTLGMGIVVDYCPSGNLDIAVNW